MGTYIPLCYLDTAKSRFFIALLPPQEIQDYTSGIKQEFADRYSSCGAQKSPPHITLQPPFKWSVKAVPILEDCLREFAQTRSPVPVTLSGFGAFAPRVIYINVLKTPELLSLQADLMAYLEAKLSVVDAVSKTRAFAPHMTVAFRDLTRQNFTKAWPEFQKRSLQFDFTCDRLTLLIHDGNQWHANSYIKFG